MVNVNPRYEETTENMFDIKVVFSVKHVFLLVLYIHYDVNCNTRRFKGNLKFL